MRKFNLDLTVKINRTIQLADTFHNLAEIKEQINNVILPAMAHLELNSEEEGDKMFQGLQMVADEIHDYLATFQLVAERRTFPDRRENVTNPRFEGAQPK